MLTVSSFIFYCDLETAKFVAECANLHLELAPWNSDEVKQVGVYSSGSSMYYRWQDRATGGGGCRIVWKNGVAWISRHSGYAYADITQEVSELFTELGCEPATGRNPSTI